METSVLRKKYVEATRPYSQNELKDLREKNLRNMYIGDKMAKHESCGHFYLVKKNGKKEKELVESNGKNSGNCSVCWVLRRVPRKLKGDATDLIEEYNNCFLTEPSFWSYDLVELEKDFYTLLYKEVTSK